MPNLENLRKQAKQHLRWHRDGYHPVAVQIRAWLPGYSHLSDRDVLAGAFRLADAQELVARRAGFASWASLRQEVHTVTRPPIPTQPAPVILGAEPQVFVSDMAGACAFYADKLGFAVAFTYGEPAYYGQVARGGARLNLRCVDGPALHPARRDRDFLLAATVTLEGVKALFLEYQAAGVPLAQTLRTEPWGARTFIVRDPDGNLILFSGTDGVAGG